MRSYVDMRGETLALIAARPSETVVFSFVMIAALASFAGRLAELFARQAGGEPLSAELVRGHVGAVFIGCFLLMPLGAYLLGLIIGAAAQAAGGRGGFYETRLALFWSAAVAAPLMLALSLITVLERLGGVSPEVASTLGLAPSAYWVYLFASAQAAAHGWASARPVLGAIAAAALLAVGVVFLTTRG